MPPYFLSKHNSEKFRLMHLHRFRILLYNALWIEKQYFSFQII